MAFSFGGTNVRVVAAVCLHRPSSLLLGNLELRDEEGQDSRCVHVTYVHSTVACFSDVQAVHIVKGALVKVFNTPVTLTVDFNSKNKGGSEVKLNKSAHCKCR